MRTLKSLLMLCCIMAFSTAAWAQPPALSQGTWQVGGQLGFNYSGQKMKTDGEPMLMERYMGIKVAPAANVFVSDKFAIGGTVQYETDITKVPQYLIGERIGKTKTLESAVMFGPTANYYIPVGSRDFAAIYLNAAALYGPSWFKYVENYEDLDRETQRDFGAHNINLAFGGGVEFWPTDCFGIRAGVGGLGVDITTWKDDLVDDKRNTETTVNIKHTLTRVRIGANYYFGYDGATNGTPDAM